ncbi:MAG: response regulator transcription factor, partial [Rhodococcus sp. (in: high G+C Gram-positive bacteria)]
GLARVLSEQGHQVVSMVGDADALVRTVDDDRPDLAIIDIRMPPDLDSDGARAAVALRRTHPELGIVLLSQHIELKHALPLIGTSGFGYLLKDRVLDLSGFADSLQRVAAGGTALDPEVVRALVKARSKPSALEDLSDREYEVLGLVAQGHSNTSVAEQLSLSDRTVEAHMRSVFTKLGLHDDGSTHRRVLAVVKYLEAR